ncbi:hypothetical protein AB0368_36325 [Actinoplanes sp. NPDC051475]|uniref:hypothetical protein n=1 Tax=Actinoplanes sp. NPDC051475 TaxID=3157225 RepID=UPI00344D057F
MRPTVWLSDLVRACAAAGARTAAQRKRIAAMLGLAAVRQSAPPPPAAPVPVPAPAPQHPAPAPAVHAGPAQPVRDTIVEALAEAKELPVFSPEPAPALARQPLLDPRFAPSILQMAVRRHVAGGAFDVDAAVRILATAQPLVTMPRRKRATSAFGVQVLVDLGTGMQPFAEDHEDVLAVLDRLLGASRIRVSYFADCPVRGAGPAGNASWRPWTPPARGTRVLLLTDLGIGGFPFDPTRARAAEWRRFGTQARQSGVEPVAFVPYPPGRWPAWAVAAMPVVHWDRRTTAAGVDAAMRRRR